MQGVYLRPMDDPLFYMQPVECRSIDYIVASEAVQRGERAGWIYTSHPCLSAYDHSRARAFSRTGVRVLRDPDLSVNCPVGPAVVGSSRSPRTPKAFE